ncbi:MAG: Hsp20 family protein [Paludibacteraceae bacterium]|nr:Hsp20 family protein [Paludibacteraceae bacterium]
MKAASILLDVKQEDIFCSAKAEDGILSIELPKLKREEGKTSRQIAIS